MTTATARRIPARQATIPAPAAAVARDAVRTLRRPAAAPPRDWPRPPLIHDHRTLFREPAYTDGQPYADDDDLEDDEPAG